MIEKLSNQKSMERALENIEGIVEALEFVHNSDGYTLWEIRMRQDNDIYLLKGPWSIKNTQIQRGDELEIRKGLVYREYTNRTGKTYMLENIHGLVNLTTGIPYK